MSPALETIYAQRWAALASSEGHSPSLPSLKKRGRQPTKRPEKVQQRFSRNPTAATAQQLAEELDIEIDKLRRACRELISKGYLRTKRIKGSNFYLVASPPLTPSH